MVAGRQSSFGYGELKDRVSRGEIGRNKRVLDDRVRGRNRDYKRGETRENEYGMRHGGIKKREVMMNCEESGVLSSKSDSGSCGGVGLWRCRSNERGVDREPGELSSESGSDGGVDDLDSRVKENEKRKLASVNRSLAQGKKRKFSPIIRERDDKAVSSVLKERDSRGVSNLPKSSMLPKSLEASKVGLDDGNCMSPKPCKISKIQVPEPTKSNVELDPPISTSSSSVIDQTFSGEAHRVSNDMETNIVKIEDAVPLRNIKSSRWANDFDSPSAEGEIFEDEEMPKLKKNISDTAGIRALKNSATTEIGKLTRDESLGVRCMSSESGERVWSSSRDSCSGLATDNNNMEEDEDHHYDGGNASQSDTELENAHDSPKLDFSPRRNVNMLHGCRSVDEFQRLNKINEGTYGVVYRARDKKTGEIVALKKVKMEREREGFPLTALREINILLSFDHSSIVDVKEIVVGSSLDDIFLVMEYMEHDLKAFLKTRKHPFSESEVKCLMLQLLKGTKYLHDNWVLHRDLKTSNLLLNNSFELKICDFGLARQYGSPLKPYTQLVVTLSYRAPELLLGAKQYSTAIDMWSLGCIMAELLSKETLFNGKSEIDQIDKIFRTLGTPNDTIWPGYSKLPGAKGTFVKNKNNMLRKKFPPSSFTGAPVLSDAGFDLLNKLLTYDPEARISAEAALEHKWFQEIPPSKDKEQQPTFLFWHGQDRHVQRITKGSDPLKDLQWKELQQWGSTNGGVFG